MLPTIARQRSPRLRLKWRMTLSPWLSRWGWCGLLLLWGTAVATLLLARAA